jgi:hypothetical protein
MGKNIHDKYFTPQDVVDKTVKKVYDLIGIDNVHSFIEPAAGDGAFIEALKKTGKPCYFSDLYPEHPEVIEADFLRIKGERIKGRVIISNPPYGSASSLFKKFAKKGAELGDWIIFVSPASQYNSNYYLPMLELVDSEHLGDVEYYGSEEYEGKPVKVRTCINTYRVKGEERNEVEDKEARVLEDFEIASLNENNIQERGRYYDWRMAQMGSRIGQLDPEIRTLSFYGIKIKNEKLRNKADAFFQNFRAKYLDEITLKSDSITTNKTLKIPFLIDKIYEEFYAPKTKEQRVLEDFEIKDVVRLNSSGINGKAPEKSEYKAEDLNYDWYILISGMPGIENFYKTDFANNTAGCSFKNNELKYNRYFGIKIKNKEKYEIFSEYIENFLKYNYDWISRQQRNFRITRPFLIEKIYEEFYAPKTKEQRVLEDFEIRRLKNRPNDYDYFMPLYVIKNRDNGISEYGYYIKCIGKIKPSEAQWDKIYLDIFKKKGGKRIYGANTLDKPLLIEKIYEEFYAHEDQQTPEDKTLYFPPEYGDNEELWIEPEKKKAIPSPLF